MKRRIRKRNYRKLYKRSGMARRKKGKRISRVLLASRGGVRL